MVARRSRRSPLITPPITRLSSDKGIPISRNRVRNLMRRMGLRAIYQKPRTTVPGDPSMRFPRLVDFREITAVDQALATDITYIPLQKGFLYLVRSWICFPGTCSAGRSPTALTRSSVSMPWRWHWKVAGGQRYSTPTRADNSPLVTSWPGCMLRRSRSAGQEGSAATTTSWWRGCGERSSTRRCTCMPTGMAGRPKSAWPDSCGGTAM